MDSKEARLPPLKSLRVFQIAAEQGSFKLAAEKLNVTQAAVSQQIRQLEAFIEVELFRRLSREVRLTAEGEQLLPYVQRGFGAFLEGMQVLSRDPNPNRLTITTVPSFAGSWLVPKLGLFQQRHPEISCHLSLSHAIENFSDGVNDIGVRFGRGNYPGLEAKQFSRDFNVPLCHPLLLQQLGGEPGAIGRLPLLIDDSPELDRMLRQFHAIFDNKCCGPTTNLTISDSNMLVDAALSGQGLALVRFSLAYELIERGQLVCPLPVYWHSPYSYYLVAPKGHFSRPKVEQFEAWIMEETAGIERAWERFRQQRGLKCID
ncbi:LysR substrate-binding domain-containing protein [Marinobacterium jannaschii]|uniref:LysR substrate-binding domain-containing protein n=1 Tax=Marinobacterium jannaschii TaxID=64970 RepID=UPI00047F09DE|nr:LysR substrate-binding domain-containing protein [Marinobacterium jannaschii]